MHNIITLSYELNHLTPSYNNEGGFKSSLLTSIKQGRSANSAFWSFNNHLGTHIDFPYHFNNNGKTFSDYPAGFFWLQHIAVIHCNVAAAEVITPASIEKLIAPLSKNIEALFLNTGFGKNRMEDVYWKEGPAFHPDLYHFLRLNFPLLRFFGFDAISLTSLMHRSMGKAAHQAFLLNDNPILIIEDVNFSNLPAEASIQEMIISPLPVANADGAPVNIVAKIR
jgi:kynurenine formamidase